MRMLKVAISDSRIVRFDDTHVTFRYRKVHSNRLRTMRLPAAAFLHRLGRAQHPAAPHIAPQASSPAGILHI
jgi:hypothetical protein